MPYGDVEFGGESSAAAAAAGVENAGGMEGGGAAGADSLAIALADALSAGYSKQASADYGYVAALDVAASAGGIDIEAQGQAFNEAQAAQAQEAAAIQAAMASADPGGIGAAPGVNNPYADPAFVDTFATGGYATAPATSDLSFGAYGQQTKPGMSSQEVLGSGYAPSRDMVSPVEQGSAAGQYDFMNQTQAGTPGFPSVVGTGVESFVNNPYAEMAGTGTGGPGMAAPLGSGGDVGAYVEESQMGMAPPLGQGQMQGGLLSAATGIPAGTTTMAGSGAGAITAGTTAAGGALEDQTIETDIARRALTQDAGQDALPVNFVNQKVADITAKVNTPEANTAAHKQVAQERLDMQKTLDEKAKTDPYGRVLDKFRNKTTVTNRQLATAYRSFDTTLAAYATINGVSSLAAMIANNLPGVNAASKTFGSITAGLVNMGIFNKTSPQDIVSMIAENLAAGLRPGMDSQWEAGPSDEDVQGPKEISAFIQQYPWAAELDPRYIKYLIDTPAALQDLLGQQA
jgi:hypothetical protein